MPLEALVPTGIDCRAHEARLSKFPHEGPLRAEGPQGRGAGGRQNPGSPTKAAKPEKVATSGARPPRPARRCGS